MAHPADRLAPLLTAVNNDSSSRADVVRAMNAFTEAFGDADAMRPGKVQPDPLVTDSVLRRWLATMDLPRREIRRMLQTMRPAERTALNTRIRLHTVLAGRVWGAPVISDLRVGVRGDRGVVLVYGPRTDVVCLLVVCHLATHRIVIAACPAPAAGRPGHPNPFSRERVCGRLFVAQGQRGRPKRFCSGACVKRAENPRWQALRRKEKGR
jgi:hypothetical protein